VKISVTAKNVVSDLGILLKLIGIGIVLTILSSLAGIIFVMRYDPLTILANRD
jgi:putative ABC transport system permease protein